MDFSTLALDIDGTLGNPLIAVVLALYTTGLSVAAFVAVRRLQRDTAHRAQASVALLVVAVFALLNGPIIRAFVALVVTASSTFRGAVGVGYFGHHPSWITPVVVLGGALLGTVRRATKGTAVA
jgi:hypothetical protein